MLDVLVDKVSKRDFKKLIVLTTRIDDINADFQFTAWAHRRKFVEALVRAGGSLVVVCQYRSKRDLGARPEAELAEKAPYYVHSKTWVFDDEFLIVGSANCKRRGYSHDSEVNVGVYDTEKEWVRDLRIRMWLRRLNGARVKSTLTAADLRDFLSAARYWEEAAKYGLTIENDGSGLASSLRWPPRIVETDVPSAVRVLGADAWPDQQTMSSLIQGLKSEVLWNIAVDPDGS